VDLKLGGGLDKGQKLLTVKTQLVTLLQRASEFDRFFKMTQAMENGFEIWMIKCLYSLCREG
jgi:hypothetical protein